MLVLKLMHLLSFLLLWCQRQALIFKMCLFISPISFLGVLFLFASFEHKNQRRLKTFGKIIFIFFFSLLILSLLCIAFFLNM